MAIPSPQDLLEQSQPPQKPLPQHQFQQLSLFFIILITATLGSSEILGCSSWATHRPSVTPSVTSTLLSLSSSPHPQPLWVILPWVSPATNSKIS